MSSESSSDDPVEACVCPAAGFCERHRILKSEHLHRLCSEVDGYFELWESGVGPLQKPRPDAVRERRLRERAKGIDRDAPGSVLAENIRQLGYTVTRGCQCKSKIATMNLWGVEGCRERIEEIVDWLERSAKRAGWFERFLTSCPVVRSGSRKVLRQLVEKAIRDSEKRLAARSS